MDGRGFKRERSRRSLQGRRCITGGRISFEAAYTSYLKRAVKTLNCVLDRLDEDWIPVEKTWRLNEKHYGMLQGLNKSETTVQYGEEQVHIWRRSYDVAPAPVGKDDPRNPGMDIRYAGVPDSELPRTESLKDTIGRVMPYWKCIIFPALMYKDSLLVVAHGNSLRGIIKHLKGISDTDISNLNLPTAVPYVFEFDDRLVLVKDYYLETRKRYETGRKLWPNKGWLKIKICLSSRCFF